jgi:hypothetical protein
MVERFINSSDPTDNIVLSDRLLISQCFKHFKHLYKDMQRKGGGTGVVLAPSSSGPTKEDSIELKRL